MGDVSAFFIVTRISLFLPGFIVSLLYLCYSRRSVALVLFVAVTVQRAVNSNCCLTS